MSCHKAEKKVVSYAVDELLALTVFLVIFGFCISCTITVTNCGQSRKKLKEQKQLYRVNCEHTEQKDAQYTALHIAQRWIIIESTSVTTKQRNANEFKFNLLDEFACYMAIFSDCVKRLNEEALFHMNAFTRTFECDKEETCAEWTRQSLLLLKSIAMVIVYNGTSTRARHAHLKFLLNVEI